MAIRGRGSKLVSGRGRNPPEPSPGVQNDQNKRQKLGIDDASKQKHNYTSDYEDTNEYYLSNNIEDAGDNHQAAVTNNVKKCKGVSFGISNNLRQSSGGIRNGQGRGFNDPSEPSQSCTSPAAPPHMSFSTEPSNYSGWKSVHSTLYGRVDKRQNHGLTRADEYNARKASAERHATYGMRQGLNDQEMISPFNRKRGIRNCQGRGFSDPPKPSQPSNYSGWRSVHSTLYGRVDKRQNHGLPGADECYAYNDSEDEGMHLIWEKQNQQETDTNDSRKGTDTKNATKGTAGSLGVSNSEKMNNATLGSFPRSTDPPTNNSTSVPSTEGSHDRRKVISVEAVSNPRRFVPQTVTRDIISRVITRMPTPAEKWKDYPSEMKDELFKEFTGKYKFTSDYDCNMSRTVWERTCMDRYPDHLKNARKMALREVNSVNLVDTKGHAPKGMKAEVWDGLVDIWLKPEWKKKSDANRCNRAALPDAVLHTGGSINFGEHKIRMEKELNHEVSYRDVYDRVHKKKDGEYVSQRSKKFIETYDTAMLEKYGDDFSTHPAVDSNLWADTFSHHKTRQTFVGRSLDLGGFVSASSAEFTGPSNILATSEEAIKKAVDKAMSSFVQSQLMPLLEPIISLIQSMHKAPMQGEFAEGHMDARSLGKK